MSRSTVPAVADGTSGGGWIGRLIADGFFDGGTTGYAVFMELKRLGAKLTKRNAYNWCNAMQRTGFLTLEGRDSYEAVVGMKVNIVDKAA